MAKQFHLDIITPTSIDSFEKIEYLRIPSMDGLIGIQAKHAQAIIGLNIGEIQVTKNGEKQTYATSGGFADIKNEGVQLLLETVESADDINQERAKKSLQRAKKRLNDNAMDLKRANKALSRAKNRLSLFSK